MANFSSDFLLFSFCLFLWVASTTHAASAVTLLDSVDSTKSVSYDQISLLAGQYNINKTFEYYLDSTYTGTGITFGFLNCVPAYDSDGITMKSWNSFFQQDSTKTPVLNTNNPLAFDFSDICDPADYAAKNSIIDLTAFTKFPFVSVNSVGVKMTMTKTGVVFPLASGSATRNVTLEVSVKCGFVKNDNINSAIKFDGFADSGSEYTIKLSLTDSRACITPPPAPAPPGPDYVTIIVLCVIGVVAAPFVALCILLTLCVSIITMFLACLGGIFLLI